MLILAALIAIASPDSTLLKPADSVRITVPRVAKRPVLDGRLDDETWVEAAKLGDFVQFEPKDMIRAQEKSIAYVAYDSDYLFLAFRAFESRPGQVRATVFPRERGGEGDDRVTFVLDTFLDKRRAFEFKSNPFGIQADGTKVEGQPGDSSPDFVWYSAGRPDEEGWAVEMMIPWASLRFPSVDTLSIGFNVARIFGRNGVKDSWVPRRHGNPCEICQEGVLTGITGINAHRTIDVLPYVSGSRTGARRFAADSLFSGGRFFGTRLPLGFDTGRPRGAAGGDVKIALTSSAILNATLNPDFSQVESDDDQVRVNQRFTLFQSERRPFFVEGRDAFELPRSSEESRSNIGDLFYSRAIVDPAAGARVTTREGRVTMAGLYVRDDQPGYFSYNGFESSGYRPLVATTADIVVARARADILADSYIGVTALGRRAGYARNGVGAMNVALRRGALTFSGEGGFSSDRAPLEVAVSPVLDGKTRTGAYYRGRLSLAGRNSSLSAIAAGADSDFRDQLGRFSRVGIQQLGANATVIQYPGSGFLQRTSQGVAVTTASVFGGGLLDYTITVPLAFQFQKATSFTLTPLRQHLTLFGNKLDMSGVIVDADSKASQVIAASGNFYIGDREIVDQARSRVGKGYSAGVQLIVRPVPQASVEVKGQRSWHADRWNSPLVDDARILRAKGSYQFTRALGIRLIQEYSNQYDTRNANPFYQRDVRSARSVLMSYELGPASFLYLGYNEGHQNFDEPIVETSARLRTENLLFMKLSYLVRM